MESQGVDDFITVQIKAVKLIGIKGDKGGIDGFGGQRFGLLLYNTILFRTL